jgi:translation initiation factor IF-2
MAKMKITTLTDKAGNDDILAKLKSLGVKIKEKQTEEPIREEKQEGASSPADRMVEKRVASTVIRRRVLAPVPEPQEPKIEAASVKEAAAKRSRAEAEAKPEGAADDKTRKQPRPVEKRIRLQPREPEPGEQQAPVAEAVPTGPEAPLLEAAQGAVPQREEPLKGDIEHIGEAKEKEITRVLEEAYGKAVDTGVVLGEDEEERKKKKAERLLKKIEEQELEEGLKKGAPRRKVIIKQEDQYATRRKGKPIPFKKGGRDRSAERFADDDRRADAKPARKSIKIGENVVIGELAKKMGVKAQELIGKLLSVGTIATINQAIDYDTTVLMASEFGFEVEKVLSIEEDFMAREEEQRDIAETLLPRPPVVTIMGHVDHGKTLLLDTIRHTNVAEREAGGITQHIGAYKVNIDGKQIVFIDTPGHEAFTSMRARGALVTDIVVLVVAADDGVMPQTVEAIDHAKSAKVPIIVAVNKIDKNNANPDKVMKELADFGLIPEEWGGSTLTARISAKKNTGIQELLELIVLQADMLELKANPDKHARGIIIESRLDKGHGPVGTLIVQEGTLKIHDPFIAGSMFGRVRAMIDDKGKKVLQAPPSSPVVVVGFQEVPNGGDSFIVTTEERYARELSRFRQEKLKERELVKSARTTLEDFYSKIGASEKVGLGLIIKGDVRGTIDAIGEALKRLSNEKAEVQIVHSGVGAITETDVNLAMATGAIIVGFNTKPIGKAQAIAEHEKVQIRTYAVIYDMIDDIKKAMEGLLAPTIKEVPIGKGEVRKVFVVSKSGTIAGSYVTEGKVTRNALVRLMRQGSMVFTGKLSSLKRFKDDAKEVLAGYECGIALEGFNSIQEGDIFEFYIEESEAQTLDG